MTAEEMNRNYKNILRMVLQRSDTCYYCQSYGINPTDCNCKGADACIERMLHAQEEAHRKEMSPAEFHYQEYKDTGVN